MKPKRSSVSAAARKPSSPEPERQRRPALKFNQELAEQFGITPGADAPRETVAVRELPDPPLMENAPAAPSPKRETPLNLEEQVLNVMREEFEELSVRLDRYGVALTAPMKQEMLDHTFALLGGYAFGGTLARR